MVGERRLLIIRETKNFPSSTYKRIYPINFKTYHLDCYFQLEKNFKKNLTLTPTNLKFVIISITIKINVWIVLESHWNDAISLKLCYFGTVPSK